MGLFFPARDPYLGEFAADLAHRHHCSPQATDEVCQYASVLGARGMPAEYIAMMVSRYAKIRGEDEQEYRVDGA